VIRQVCPFDEVGFDKLGSVSWDLTCSYSTTSYNIRKLHSGKTQSGPNRSQAPVKIFLTLLWLIHECLEEALVDGK